jgi:hypothetical protein
MQQKSELTRAIQEDSFEYDGADLDDNSGDGAEKVLGSGCMI